jgi:hydrogenase maturation protease
MVKLHRPSRITVVGVGNLVHMDDGLGIHAIQKLRCDPRVANSITLIDGGTFGLELLAYVQDCSKLLLLDAVDIGERPGTLVRMTGQELFGLPGGASVHQLGVADLLATLPLVSDAPREIVLLGVQPASTDWGAELSAPVAAVLGNLVDAAVEQLQRWSDAAAAADAASAVGAAVADAPAGAVA